MTHLSGGLQDLSSAQAAACPLKPDIAEISLIVPITQHGDQALLFADLLGDRQLTLHLDNGIAHQALCARHVALVLPVVEYHAIHECEAAAPNQAKPHVPVGGGWHLY